MILKLGSRGPEVTKLQKDLSALGYDPGPPDGIYGKLTTAAVIAFQTAKSLVVDGIAGPITLGAIAEACAACGGPPATPPPVSTARGQVVPLTDQQIVTRAMYLAGRAKLSELDDYIVAGDAPQDCPAIYYLLKDHNGGKYPTAPDPADRWSNPGSTFVNRTCDCSGGNSWMHGFDRYQPVRFAHIYDGWINTDSKIMDATGPAKCFVAERDPWPGAILTCMSGSPGHTIGHEGCIVSVPDDWDPNDPAKWSEMGVVDVAANGAGRRANTLRNARGWYGTGALFLRSIMVP